MGKEVLVEYPPLIGLFDTHSHPCDNRFDSDREEVFARMRQTEMISVCVGADMPSSAEAVELAKKEPMFYASVGVHPHDAKDFTDADIPVLTNWLTKEEKVVALGEIGLDYYWKKVPAQTQIYWFERQLDLAYELNLPVVIHSRDAMAQTIEILKKHKIHKGVFHCYSGSKETLKELVKMGFSISLGGVVTFKNARRAVECAAQVPLDRLMLETDCPFMAPEPHRGKTNRPDYTMYVAEKIGELRQMTGQQIADITRENAIKFFNL